MAPQTGTHRCGWIWIGVAGSASGPAGLTQPRRLVSELPRGRYRRLVWTRIVRSGQTNKVAGRRHASGAPERPAVQGSARGVGLDDGLGDAPTVTNRVAVLARPLADRRGLLTA